MFLASSADIKKPDNLAASKYGIPETELMENAGKSIFNRIKECFPNEKFAIFCGKGNNGGDGGAGSALSDIAGLGVTLGAMGGVINMTKDALNPLIQTGSEIGGAVIPPQDNGGWTCACGKAGITSKFCPECGSAKPEEKAGWDCACGKAGIT